MGRRAQRAVASCAVCINVPAESRRDLDLLMGDPTRWPQSVWGVFDAPNGPDVPPHMREWAGIEMGQEWLQRHGYADLAAKAIVRTHYEKHVPLVPVTSAQLVAAGIIADGGDAGDVPDGAIDPMSYLRYYTKGIEVGRRGLELLSQHVEKLASAKKEVPLPLIRMMVDVGAKLSVSQAQIKAREKSVGTLDDEDDFRAPSSPGDRVGHNRVHKVDGEARPVRDAGPKDREHFNERAAQEGRERL